MKDVIELFKSARRVSTPLVGIATSDQQALARRLFEAVGNGKSEAPKVLWDVLRGPKGINDSGKKMLASIEPIDVEAAAHPASMLKLAAEFTAKTITVMFNGHAFFDDPVVRQGIVNLRDPYCEDRRTMVFTAPAFNLPAELQDIVLLDEGMPDDEQITGILQRLLTDTYGSSDGTHLKKVDPDWVNATRGLSAFSAEQIFAMSLREGGVDDGDLWDRKREAINQTRGLKFLRDGKGFDALGGLSSGKQFVRGLGKRPGVILFVDEMDKTIAGGEHDSTGVSQDFHGYMLQWMENNFHDGMIAVGPPGGGKTAFGMAIGPTLGIPVIVLDPGGLKQKHVGESEDNVRQALKVVQSVGGADGVFVFGTCNSEARLSPEFKRRFRSGEWYFDLPTEEERNVIWPIHLGAYDLDVDMERPDDAGWTGAEIRNCCDLASRMNSTLVQASAYIVPVSRSSRSSIKALREAAEGNWLSASYPGAYSTDAATIENRRRKVELAVG